MITGLLLPVAAHAQVSYTGSASVSVNPGTATHLVIPGGPEPFYTVFSFNIYAYDAEGNLATSYNGTVAFTSSDPGFVNLGPVTLVNGVGSQSAVLKTAGTDSITATDTTNPSITGTGYFTIQPGVATHFGVSAPSSTYAGSPFSVTVTAYDLYGNVASGYAGTIHFTTTDIGTSVVLPANYTYVGGDAGSHTFSNGATLVTAGTQTITATDGANLIVGTTGGILVTNPNYVVTVATDGAGTGSNCTIQSTPGTNTTDTSCSLRDALAAAGALGTGSITFSSTAFSTAQTIVLTYDGLTIPANTSIIGPTTGSGSSLTNLVTVNGNSGFTDFAVGSGVTGASINNLIIAGGGSDHNGGGIDNEGTLTVAGCTISGNFADNGVGAGSGGGIYNGGTLTVTDSTVTGNSAGGNGGGIYDAGASLTVTNSTFSGNSAGDYGGGIMNNASVLDLANTIVAGNTAPTNADVNGGFTDKGGNQISTAVNLSALGSYGGPTQTMISSPVSTAICSGTTANATAAGITTDQRGFVLDPNCPMGSVDAGAVQTNYMMGFNNVPHTTVSGQVISPAPIVTLYESGAISTASTAPVTLSDASSALSGATTQNFSAGTATFPGISFTSIGLNTQLIATLALSPTVNLVATAGTTTTVSPLPAVLTSPANLSTLTGPAVAFSWSPVTGASAYSLWVGTTGAGSRDLYSSGAQTATSLKVANLPTTGGTVYVRLNTIYNGVANSNDYTFTATTRAAITSPASPGTLSGLNVTFNWSPSTGAVAYSLWLGSTGVGSSDLYHSGATTAISVTASGLPTNGETVYARLSTIYANGVSVSNDSTYTAANIALGMLSSPTPSTTLSGATVAFSWSAGTGATAYSLWLGSAGPGSNNLYQSHATTALTATATGLPTNGTTIYARLYTIYNGGVSKYIDYTYNAAP